MAWRELAEAGIDPFHDLSELKFVGFPQDEVVFQVRDGKVDAGTVRTDVLERMASQGLIELDDYRILNPRVTGRIPLPAQHAPVPRVGLCQGETDLR